MAVASRDKTNPTTINELRQYYDLEQISKTKKTVSLQENTINQINAEQSNILNSIILSMTGLESQTDMSLWFFNEVPSLINLPASDWTTDEIKNNHLGDLYFNRETGYVYKFIVTDTVYSWQQTTDSDLVQAMALTNTEIDNSINQRKVFFTIPTPSYNNGDWWLTTDGLYICQISKSSGEFEEKDFIIATKYVVGTQATEINNKVTIVAGQVTTITEDVTQMKIEIEDNKYYIDEDGNKNLISEATATIINDINGLNVQLSRTGGSNIFNNPVGYFYDGNQTADDWTGIAKAFTNTEIKNNTISGNCFLLQNSTLEQIIQIPNGTYTVSFIYKKLIPLSNCSVSINGEVITLTSSSWETKNLTFEVKSNTIDIKLISDTNDSCYVSDLMGSLGTLVQVWSNNPNEAVNGGVKIGKGIQITSNTSNIMQKMDNDGNRIINTNTGEVVSEFTDKSIDTKEIIADKGQVGKLLIVDMGSQTWLSRM